MSAETGGGLIPVICGPTAAGKSAIAMWLGARHDLAIVSADSRQVYRGFDVGTGKPPTDDQRRVPHRGLDVADPGERFSAAAWRAMAVDAIREGQAAGRQPVVVGGTGFYISTLFRPLWAEPELPGVRRQALQTALAALSTAELQRWCRTLDPARARLGRAQLLRAVEIALLTGRRLSDLHWTRAQPAGFVARYLFVDPGTDLPTRIAARAATMFDSGWTDEVERLLRTVPDSAPAWNACGYRTVRRLVRGDVDRRAALERVVIETRQYAKRQRTWFRHQLEQDRVHRMTPGAPGWEGTVERWFAEYRADARVTSHGSRSVR